MAASLSRPDPTSPASVAEAGFSTARRGYSPDEVRAFLASVSAEMRRLHERERQLEAELRAARAAAPGRVELDDETVTNLLGEETLRVLQTARESASQIKTRAEESAARTLREAHDEANRLRQDAEIDAARRRQDAQSEAEAEVALAKQQGREMVNEARAYRERVLADLERRTKLARQQIEELAHGRDRLLQVFERARLVAVDVTSELQSFSTPDEDVNFSPTTGPVPVMLPSTPRPPERQRPVADEQPVDPTAALPVDLRPEAPADAEPTDDTDDTVAEVETVDDTVTDDTVTDDTTDDETDDTAEADATVEADEANEADGDTDDTEAAAEVEAVETPQPARDTNVVALFPHVQPTIVTAPETEPDVDPAPRPAVDDLFARLRSETAVTEAAGETAAERLGQTVSEDVAAADDSDVVAVESTPFTRRDEALVPLIVNAARKLKRILADEQNGVLDTLRRREPVRSLDDVLPALDAHLATYSDAVADELAAAAAAGAAELGANDTPTLRRTLAKAGALDGARGVMRSDLVGPLRDRLDRSIVDGGGDNEDITRRVRAVYREWKTQHIDDQLDDVFRYAFGGGVAVTAEPGTLMRWLIDPSEPACADCEDNSLAGPVAVGESYPTGHTSAPAHPGCRCLTLPTRQ